MFLRLHSMLILVSIILYCTPQWVTKPPVGNTGYLYFRGVSADLESVQDSKNSAVEDAVAQIVAYMGVSAERTAQYITNELRSSFIDQLSFRGSGNIRDFKIEDIYTEETKNTYGDTVYRTYVLIRYSSSELMKEQKRRSLANSMLFRELEERHRRAQEKQQEKDFFSAVTEYITAFEAGRMMYPDFGSGDYNERSVGIMIGDVYNDLIAFLSGIHIEKPAEYRNAGNDGILLRVTAESDGRSNYVMNFPIKFGYLHNNEIVQAKTARSDEGGKIVLPPDHIGANYADNVIGIECDDSQLRIDSSLWRENELSGLETVLNRYSGTIRIKPLVREDLNPLYVDVKINILGLQDDFTQSYLRKIENGLIGSGFRLVKYRDDAKIVINGIISTREVDRVEGIVVACSPYGYIEIEGKDGTVLKTVVVKEKNYFGETPRAASIAALSDAANGIIESLINELNEID